ncbi:MAG: PfkB family carbohydrate kinase [Candidatus Omnitrophica bacterium]|nr:PfkB family carbohydrate kinase [Candidatus Omnitrophota bacterium]
MAELSNPERSLTPRFHIAAQSRLKPFFARHGLGVFQDEFSVLCAAVKTRELFMSGELRPGNLVRLNNEILSAGEVRIKDNDITTGTLPGGQEYAVIVFDFKKYDKQIRVLLLKDHTALGAGDLKKLREFGIKNKADLAHLSDQGSEGVWFIAAEASPEAISAARAKLIDALRSENMRTELPGVLAEVSGSLGAYAPRLFNIILRTSLSQEERIKILPALFEMFTAQAEPGSLSEPAPAGKRHKVIAVGIKGTVDFFPDLAKGTAVLNGGGEAYTFARSLRRLGMQIPIYGFLGTDGKIGAAFEKLLLGSGLSARYLLRVKGLEAIYCSAAGGEPEIGGRMPGPEVTGADTAMLEENIFAALEEGDRLVVAGWIIPGVARDFHLKLLDRARKMHVETFYNTKDIPLLKMAIRRAPPYLVAMNTDELAKVYDRDAGQLNDIRAVMELGNRLIRSGVRIVLVTMGSRGALMLTGDAAFFSSAPRINPVSTIGAGDSFLAGFVYALDKDPDLVSAFKLAAATAAATTLEPGTNVCASLDKAREFLPAIEISNVSQDDSFRSARDEAQRIHDENLRPEYMPAIPKNKILCHIIAESILPVEQRKLLHALEKETRGGAYSEKIVALSTEEPDKYIDELRSLMARQAELYKDRVVEFDITCPSVALVGKVQRELGVRAVSFKPCEGGVFEVAGIEYILLVLRALDTGNIDLLKEAFAFVPGNKLSAEQLAMTDIDLFVKAVTFILPAVKVEDYDERKAMNDLIERFIEEAA